MLSTQAINEFKQLYKTEFGIELTQKETANRANNFIKLYGLLSGLSPNNENEKPKPTSRT